MNRSFDEIPVSVQGGALACLRGGQGASCLVMVHGWTLDRRIWQSQMEGLAADFALVSYDRRGFGASTAPAALSLEAEDLLALLDAQGVDRAVLVAQSQGARIALAFALRHPERVASLVLQGAPVLEAGAAADAEEIPYARYREMARMGMMEAMRQHWLRHPLMHSDDAAVARRLSAMVASYSGSDLLADDPGLPLDVGQLAAVECPVLALVGDHETAARRHWAVRLAELLPRGAMQVIEGAGHLCNAEQPERFNAAVRDFALG